MRLTRPCITDLGMRLWLLCPNLLSLLVCCPIPCATRAIQPLSPSKSETLSERILGPHCLVLSLIHLEPSFLRRLLSWVLASRICSLSLLARAFASLQRSTIAGSAVALSNSAPLTARSTLRKRYSSSTSAPLIRRTGYIAASSVTVSNQRSVIKVSLARWWL